MIMPFALEPESHSIHQRHRKAINRCSALLGSGTRSKINESNRHMSREYAYSSQCFWRWLGRKDIFCGLAPWHWSSCPDSWAWTIGSTEPQTGFFFSWHIPETCTRCCCPTTSRGSRSSSKRKHTLHTGIVSSFDHSWSRREHSMGIFSYFSLPSFHSIAVRAC